MEIAGTRAMAHQDVAKIVDRFDDDVNHGSFALDMAPDHPSGTAAADFIVSFPSVGVYDQVGLSGFVFKGDKGDSLGSSRSLSHYNDSCQLNRCGMLEV